MRLEFVFPTPDPARSERGILCGGEKALNNVGNYWPDKNHHVSLGFFGI